MLVLTVQFGSFLGWYRSENSMQSLFTLPCLAEIYLMIHTASLVVGTLLSDRRSFMIDNGRLHPSSILILLRKCDEEDSLFSLSHRRESARDRFMILLYNKHLKTELETSIPTMSFLSIFNIIVPCLLHAVVFLHWIPFCCPLRNTHQPHLQS